MSNSKEKIAESLRLLHHYCKDPLYLSPTIGKSLDIIEIYRVNSNLWEVGKANLYNGKRGVKLKFTSNEFFAIVSYVDLLKGDLSLLDSEIRRRLAGLAYEAYLDNDKLTFRVLKEHVGSDAIDSYTMEMQLFSEELIKAIESLTKDTEADTPKKSQPKASKRLAKAQVNPSIDDNISIAK